MKKKATFTIMFFAASLMAGGALAAEGQYGQQRSTTGQQQQRSPAVGMDQQQRQQQQNLVSAQDLQDFKVMDAQGEEIGQISQVLIDVQSGRVGYAIIGEGGILGVGEDQYIVPFAALQPGQEEESLRVSMQKDQLRAAPEGDVQETLTRQMEQEIHQFYGVSPYWEESGIQQRQQQQPVQQREMRDQQQQRQQQQTPGTRAQ